MAVILFAQAAIAMAACDLQGRSPARAVAETDASPCHESAADTRNANLCLAHCQSDQQSVGKAAFTVHAMPSAPVLAVEVAPFRPVIVQVAQLHGLRPPGEPPPQILFQTFLE